MNTNSIAIRTGSARTALVMWMPLEDQQPEEDRKRQEEVHEIAGDGDDRQDRRGHARPPDELAVADDRAGRQIQRILKPAVDEQAGKEIRPEVRDVDAEDGTEHEQQHQQLSQRIQQRPRDPEQRSRDTAV